MSMNIIWIGEEPHSFVKSILKSHNWSHSEDAHQVGKPSTKAKPSVFFVHSFELMPIMCFHYKPIITL